ncbi:MAG TPA: hypothetical protein VIJ93_14935 [bacterium]
MNLNPTKKPFLSSFFLSLFCFVSAFTFFISFFQTDDDLFTILITKGIGVAVKPSEYIFFMNFLVGLGLKTLNTLNDRVPWYGIFLAFTLFLGLWAFLMAVLLTKNPVNKLLLFAPCFLGIDLYFFINFHYTSISLLTCEGALLLLISSIENRVASLKPIALSGTCLLIASLIRLDAFLLSGLLFFPFLFKLMTLLIKDPLKNSKNIYGLTFFIILIISSSFTSRLYFQRSPDWKTFNQLIVPLTRLIDYRNFEYDDKTKKYFDEIQWNRTDTDLFRNWFFLDKKKYSLENLIKLDGSLPLHNLDKKNQVYPPELIFTNGFSKICFLYFLCLIIFVPLKKVWIPCLSLAWVFAIHYFLYYFMKSPPWIYCPLLVFPTYLCIYHSVFPIPQKNSKNFIAIKTERNLKTLLLLLLIAVSILIASINYFNNKKKEHFETLLKETIYDLHPSPNQLYVVWHNTIPYEEISVFDDSREFKNFNIFQLQGFQRSPVNQEILDHFGIKNLFSEMVDNPNLFMICTPEEGDLYQKFMLEKYKLVVLPKNVFHCPFFNVFKIFSLKNPAKHS